MKWTVSLLLPRSPIGASEKLFVWLIYMMENEEHVFAPKEQNAPYTIILSTILKH